LQNSYHEPSSAVGLPDSGWHYSG